jgi:acyl dehydratase
MLMAYAAGVPDRDPSLYDTPGTLGVHPMYPVSPEWQLVIDNADILAGDLAPTEARRGVHADHHVVLHRALRPGLEVTLTGELTAVERRRGGAARTLRIDAVTDDGSPVWTTTMTSVFRGVDLDGDPVGETTRPSPRPEVGGSPIAQFHHAVGDIDALVYTECARIWNPIHTDAAVARAAGLDRPILHGTATLARAVSAVATHRGRPVAEVVEIAGSFAAMVPNGTSITIRVLDEDGDTVRFDVRNAEDDPAVRDGVVRFRSA